MRAKTQKNQHNPGNNYFNVYVATIFEDYLHRSCHQTINKLRIYNDILLATDSNTKKKGVKALTSYGKKAIPFIQELRSMETNDQMKNYIFDAITQIYN